MNNSESKYASYALVQEMLQTVDVARGFDVGQTTAVAQRIKSAGRLMMTGEGSSRLFPAKNTIRKGLAWGVDVRLATDGSRQSSSYDLSRFAVFMASNSGKTKEVILLARQLAEQGNPLRFGLTANHNTLLADACTESWVLRCGKEDACAATKSVFEQAMFYQSIDHGDEPAPALVGEQQRQASQSQAKEADDAQRVVDAVNAVEPLHRRAVLGRRRVRTMLEAVYRCAKEPEDGVQPEEAERCTHHDDEVHPDAVEDRSNPAYAATGRLLAICPSFASSSGSEAC